MKNKTKFTWKCYHCEKRNVTQYKVNFDTTKTYSVEESCSCGKTTILSFGFSTQPKFKGKDDL